MNVRGHACRQSNLDLYMLLIPRRNDCVNVRGQKDWHD